MPNYGTLPLTGTGSGVGPTVLSPGDQMLLFNAETPSQPQASIAISRSSGPAHGEPSGILFTIAAPSGTILIQASNQDIDSTYQTLHTSTNLANDFYADAGNFAFYRAKMSAGTGVVTVIAQR